MLSGHGGIKVVARAAGASPSAVSRGVARLEAGIDPSVRVRQPGAGRKQQTEGDPGLGDSMSALRSTTKSTRSLAGALSASAHPVSAWTVANLLHEQGFSLQDNVKQGEGATHEDRDVQFRYLNDQIAEHNAATR